MRVLFIALLTLVSTASLWAQGQVVEGSEVLTAAQINGDVVVQELPATSLSSSNWLPPRDSSTSDNLSLIEASRVVNQNTLTLPPLPPTPLQSDFQPQISSLTIQAVPEPNSVVLSAVGLLTSAAIFRRSKVFKHI
jgi:hypothetical protein